MGVGVVGGQTGIDAQRAQEILGKGERDAPQRRRPDERELGPAVQEGRQPPPGFPDIDEIAARAGHGAGQFGQGERATEGKEAAHGPHRHERQGPGELVGNARRRPEDPGADGGTDQNSNGTPEPERAGELGGGGGGGGGCGWLGHGALW
ncbi:hypothetical protein GEMMAAP_13255 [Gemmatimonas phototrophica]|uniref:Uncharacterized protein n=1 Tax=Gemmatimonas phototrophica TaxID=1379270 RepID=A0A143BLM6_9BACT|nr:hypothetical protein GEMMAAP_13255 [Gemmatimonas phototrophica]